jgi:hypothetical protein
MKIEREIGWSPFSAIKKAGKAVGKTYIAVQLAPVKYQVKLAKKVLSHKEAWAAGVVAAGTALGIPPNVTLPLAAGILQSGKVPPGTDPRLAAYVQQNPPPGLWEQILDWIGLR